MEYKKFHFHSIIVHSIIAFSIVSAFAHIFEVLNFTILGITAFDWQFIKIFTQTFLFIMTIPATLSGISEINKMYINWHYTHKAKLVFSLILLFSTGYIIYDFVFCNPETCEKCIKNGFGLHSIFIIIINNLSIWFLSHYGLRITLGRQSFEKTSYTPDFFNKENPVDILEIVKKEIKEKPKVRGIIDIGDGLND